MTWKKAARQNTELIVSKLKFTTILHSTRKLLRGTPRIVNSAINHKRRYQAPNTPKTDKNKILLTKLISNTVPHQISTSLANNIVTRQSANGLPSSPKTTNPICARDTPKATVVTGQTDRQEKSPVMKKGSSSHPTNEDKSSIVSDDVLDF